MRTVLVSAGYRFEDDGGTLATFQGNRGMMRGLLERR